VRVDGLFDPVSLLRTLSDADLTKRDKEAEPGAAGATSSATAPPSDARAALEASGAAERAIMNPNVYGARLQRIPRTADAAAPVRSLTFRPRALQRRAPAKGWRSSRRAS
jgi:hypothetical protein